MAATASGEGARQVAVPSQAKQHAAKIIHGLRWEYPDATCALEFNTPLELLVATILSAQCTDARVNLVTRDLFKKYRSADDYAQADVADLERDIQSTGFFRNKARSIMACCQAIASEHGGEVPRDLASLVALPGIGRKTANVILGTAYGIASGIVVDTHVIRLSRRLGLTEQKDPEKIERDLIEQIPRKEWINFSHRLIHHGRRTCVARKPKCEVCVLADVCPRIGVAEA